MNAMIPHHWMAIARAERSELADFRVCELAVAISEAQRREILEMSWLVNAIRFDGVARSSDEATDRPIPVFDRPAERVCPPG